LRRLHRSHPISRNDAVETNPGRARTRGGQASRLSLTLNGRLGAWFSKRVWQSPRGEGKFLNPNAEMEAGAIPRYDLVAARYKAVLQLAQSERWREVWCGPANASGLRAIYRRCFPPTSHPIRRQNPVRGFANFGFRNKSSGRKNKPAKARPQRFVRN